jgi:hypothetical protein
MWPLVERAFVADTRSMETDKTALLAGELIIARQRLAGDAPYSPAWAATSAWVDDLERELRQLGLKLGTIVSLRHT